ncbi:hypothetical protein PHJA_002134300 [Phtheirospermum japonicum]|uniref:HIG1 domain-containing protein n=1 Tax=Phtheirospermum japonicum TaxID=374723 RepID=A0A830CNV3_9LAMI|nr:hypothetical protein PHJA_002134300 [Phtheirospermum japonicum]
MGEEKGKIESIREWVVEHKLRTVGALWASGIVGSLAYNWSQPHMKTSVKLIHARFSTNFRDHGIMFEVKTSLKIEGLNEPFPLIYTGNGVLPPSGTCRYVRSDVPTLMVNYQKLVQELHDVYPP